MTQAQTITVKAPDDSDVVYSVLTPSAGDNTPAVYRVESSLARVLRPTLSVRSKGNANGTRRVEGVASFPLVRDIDGIPTKVGNIPFDFSIALPSQLTDEEAMYAASVGGQLVVSEAMRTALASGYAPV